MKSKEAGIKESSDLFFSTPSQQARRLFYYVVCTGHFYYEDDYRLDRDNYNSFLIMHVNKGSVKIQYGNISFQASAGNTVLIDCHKPHAYASAGGLELSWFHFDGSNAKDMYEELYELYDGIICVTDSFEIISRINKIYNLHSTHKKVSEAIQSSHIARILAEFFKGRSETGTNKRSVIEEVVNYIDDNFKQELSLRNLAEKSALSEYYFLRLFKKNTGYTVHEYIISVRITNAKELLKSTRLSLKEIAYQCGFSNESSFSNTFKKQTGMTPGIFRNIDI